MSDEVGKAGAAAPASGVSAPSSPIEAKLKAFMRIKEIQEKRSRLFGKV